MAQMEFDIEYGRQKINLSDITFLIFLAGSFLITFGTVLFLANIDYENLREIVNSDIEDRYISYLVNSDFIPTAADLKDEPFQPLELDEAPSLPTIDPDLTFVSPPIKIDLDAIGELTTSADVESAESAIESDGFYRSSKNDVVRELPDWVDDRQEAYDYTIKRTAEITVKTPKYVTEKKETFSHRDQEEVMSVFYSKASSIELCYERQNRRTWIKEGFVLVEFHISPKGFVLPQTIKIIESTILNRTVEQCIIKNIRRWREFEKLDGNHGVAKVTHKFIFR